MTEHRQIPAAPFFAVLKASTSPAKPHLYQVHRDTGGESSEWIANGVSMAHASALSHQMNLNFQHLVNDYLRSAQRHEHLRPSPARPMYIVREEDDLPMATRHIRWTSQPGPMDTVLYVFRDLHELSGVHHCALETVTTAQHRQEITA